MLLERDTSISDVEGVRANTVQRGKLNLTSSQAHTVDSLDNYGARLQVLPVTGTQLAFFRSVKRESRLIPLQSWEGYVTAVNNQEGTFRARLYDLTDRTNGDQEEAVFDLSEIDEDDLELARPGGIFRWIIGYRDHAYGKRERVSGIVFRRFPSWDTADIKRAQEQGQALANALSWK